MIAAVLSDLGQVLVHFENRLFFERMATFTDRSVEDIRRVTHENLDLLARFDTGRLTPEEFYRRAVAALGARAGYDEFFAAYNDVFSVNTAVLGILRRLRPHYRLAAVSNTDPMRYGYIERRFPEILIFDAYVLSFRVGVMKPDPAIFREALARVGAEPPETLFIDDLEENIAAAETLGIRGILYRPGTDLASGLRTAGLSL
jgi:FMN phosphatase YigB (HAD superfamily)